MNVKNHETYEKIQFAEGLKGAAMNGEKLPRKVEEEKKIYWEKVKRLKVTMVKKEKMVVVMKQLNVAMLHVGSFVVTDGDGRRGGVGQDVEMM